MLVLTGNSFLKLAFNRCHRGSVTLDFSSDVGQYVKMTRSNVEFLPRVVTKIK